jgi:phosphatidylglycerophosphate synthase
VSVRSPTPSVAELRAVTQPASLFARNSGEHWAGKLYMRRISPYVTRPLLRTSLTPNSITWFMMVVGLAAAGVLTLPGLAAAAGALLLVQFQLLLDCVDGEMARWQEKRSPVGVYLDQIAHHLTETALLIALGIRADGGWDSIDDWTTLGLLAAVIQLFVKAETSLVHVARMRSGLTAMRDTREVAAPRGGFLLVARRVLGHLPFYRAFVAVEFTLIALIAAIVDQVRDDLEGTQTLLIALIAAGAITAIGHLAAILTSKRLEP